MLQQNQKIVCIYWFWIKYHYSWKTWS